MQDTICNFCLYIESIIIYKSKPVSFFKSLTSIGFTRTELANINEDDLIRLEKRLLAGHRLEGIVSKNDIDQILTVIRKYPDVLRILAGYECFYGILTGYETEQLDVVKKYHKETQARIQFVIAEYFQDEIFQYMHRAVTSNNWNDTRVLLHYRSFFNNTIVKIILGRFDAKLAAALGLLATKPDHKILNEQFAFLTDPDFYLTLDQADNRHFTGHINSLIEFVTTGGKYTYRKPFFKNVLTAMSYYDKGNYALNWRITKTFYEYGRNPNKRYAITAGIVFLLIFLLARACSGPNNYQARQNRWAPGTESVLGDQLYQTEQRHVDMKNFVEARMYPLNYPVNSWNTENLLYKYGNPFDLPLFSSDFKSIKHSDKKAINIFNNTLNGCIAILYFNNLYSGNSIRYHILDRDAPSGIHALYIPPHDSISVDFDMYLMRFYMGKRPAKFNAYRRFVYPDSVDTKFSKFTPTDSLLFSKGIVFNRDDAYKEPSQNLIISQPNATTYKLSWTGKFPFFLSQNWTDEINNRRVPDSTSAAKALILDLKRYKAGYDQSTDVDSQIQTFLPGD
jgi:hypothetical protein